jgi:hypothetical protein
MKGVGKSMDVKYKVAFAWNKRRYTRTPLRLKIQSSLKAQGGLRVLHRECQENPSSSVWPFLIWSSSCHNIEEDTGEGALITTLTKNSGGGGGH